MPSIYSRGDALEVCQTQTCLSIASDIQGYVDFNANPCDDFYQFACGNYIENTELGDAQRAGFFASADTNIVNGIHNILTGSYEDLLGANLAPDFVEGANYSSEADQRVFGLLQSYYSSCMDVETMNKEGPSPLYPIFTTIDYAASYGNNVVATRTALATHVDSLGANALWSIDVQPSAIEVGVDMILIKPVEYNYLVDFNSSDPERVAAHKSTLMKIADEVFAPNDTNLIQAAQAASFNLWAKDGMEARIDQVLQFQMKLIELGLIPDPYNDLAVALRERTMSFAELKQSYPVVDWETYFRYFVPSNNNLPESVVVGATPEYFRGLTALLNATSSGTFRDYCLFQVALEYVPSSGSRVRPILNYKETPRQAPCVGYIRRYLDIPMTRYYVMKYLGGAQVREPLFQFLTNIHQAWANRLERLDWLDEHTRANAEEKIAKIGQWAEYNINYPDDRSPTDLSNYLGPIEFGTSFGRNQMLVKRFAAVNRKYQDVGKAVNRENFSFLKDISLLNMNAFYNSLTNYISILPGIIQRPVYDASYPAYLNYGGLGATVGHEFTHGFDTNGRSYDGDGQLVNWWTDETRETYDEKAQCLIDQYSNMTVEGPNNELLHVDGSFTLAENLADNGGIGAAYEAYKTYWNSGAEKKISLPGINLTPDQLFFVNFARFYCLKTTPEYNANMLETDNHSPNIVRVRATLQNSVDFSKAYNCPVGSYMNPKEKCSVW